MKILLLGGTQEGKQLAEWFANQPQIELIYSTKKALTRPSADYTTIHGGFSGVNGLAEKLKNEGFDLLLDMTYPYAAKMSQNAVIAASLSSVPIWSFQSPPWIAEPDNQWYFYSSLPEVLEAITPYHRCFFSTANGLQKKWNTIPSHQHWFIRCRSEKGQKTTDQRRFIEGRGPLEYDEAFKHFVSLEIEVLISYDSGGKAAKAKIEAAKAASIPVFFICRPIPQQTDRQFTNITSIKNALIQDYCLNVA